MNTKTFISMLKKVRNVTPSKTSYGKLKWDVWYKIANATRNIDYGCSFDHNGICIEERDNTKIFVNYIPKATCCCINCYTNLGYIKRIQDSQRVIKLISSKFKKNVGFWRKGKGCILPRKYRSVTCLGYRCNNSRDNKHLRKTPSILFAFMEIVNENPRDTKTISVLGNTLIQLKIC